MELKKTLTTLLATAVICSCNNLPFFKKPTGYETKRMVNFLELAAKKGIAEVETDSLGSRIIKLDLKSFNDGDSKKSKNHPKLYGIFGVDELIYIDAGKKGYSKEDTLITKVSYLLPKSGNVLAHYTIKNSKNYKSGMPLMNPNTIEVKYDNGEGRTFFITDTEMKIVPSPPQEYYRLMEEIEKLAQGKSNKKEEKKENEKGKKKRIGRKGKNFNK